MHGGRLVLTANTHPFCPQCNYNLNGLPGDPVRCPECGEIPWEADLRTAAGQIERRVRTAETLLSLCVLGMWVAALGGSILLFFGGAGGGALLLSGLVVWGAGLRWFVCHIPRAEGRWGAVGWYHVTGLVWLGALSGLTACALLAFDALSARGRWWLHTAILAGALTVAWIRRDTARRFLAWPYTTAQARLEMVCRREAVRQARQERRSSLAEPSHGVVP